MRPGSSATFSSFFQNQAFLHLHATILQLNCSLASSLASTSFSLSPVQGNSLLEHFHRIGLATTSPYRHLAIDPANASLPSQKGWTEYYYRHSGASTGPLSYGIPESVPKESHPYPVIAIAASSNAWYASSWILL
jgi:DNA polymerase gamma 1